ncbi:MAG: MFS transporter [Amnibacterium sp.]
MRALLRDRDVRLLIGGQTVSAFGDSAFFLASAVWVQALTGSVPLAGLTFFFLIAPSVLAPLAGLALDRLPRRALLVAGNLATAVLLLLLLLVHDAHDVWLIWAVMAGYGCSSQLLGAGASALLPDVVPVERLGQANALNRSLREGLRIIAPAFGTGLFAVAGGGVVAIVDAATFVLAAAALLLLRVHAVPGPKEAHPPLLRSLSAGFVHLASVRVLRRTAVALGLVLLVVGFLESAGFALIVQGLHRPAAFVGVTQVAQGVGAVLGGVAAMRLMPRIGESALAVLGALAIGIGCWIWVLPPSLASALIGAVVLGAAFPWLLVGAETLVQLRTPNALLGRVFGAVEVVSSVPQTVSIAVGAGAVAVLPYAAVIAIVAVVCTGTAIWLHVGRREPAPAAA